MVAASSLSSLPSPSSPAEIQVRKIASRIGLDDSEILSKVFHKMQQEYVVAEWQLSALDSRQWEKLHAPIGLAVAVRHISAYELPSDHRLQQQQIVRDEIQIKKDDDDDNNNDDEKQLQHQQKGERMLVVEEKAPVASTTLTMMISKQEEKEDIKTVDISHEDLSCDVREGELGEAEEEINPLISFVTTPTKKKKTIVDERRSEAPEEAVENLLVMGVEENEQVKRNLFLTVSENEFDEDYCVDSNNMLHSDGDSGNNDNNDKKVVTTEEENEHEMILLSEKKSYDIGENSPIHTEEKLETQAEGNTIDIEVPVLVSSDSEPEDSIIIAAIGPSVSSSTEEDDVYDDKVEEGAYNCLLDRPINDVSSSDTLGLWLHDDDITVAASNVSPDCKKRSESRITREIKQYKQPSRKGEYIFDRVSFLKNNIC